MKNSELKEWIGKSSFAVEEDKKTFEQEILLLLAEEKTAVLVRKNTIASLKDVYLSLTASKSAFELSLLSQLGTNNTSEFLKNYFLELLGDDIQLPNQGTAIEIIVHLCTKQLNSDYIRQLLQTGALAFYSVNHLQLLKQFYSDNIKVFIDFYAEFATSHSDENKRLVLELLHILYPTSLGENTASNLDFYFKEILPHFISRFGHRTDLQIHKHVDRITEWFMVWLRYQEKTEQHLEQEDSYYEMEFATIIKYIPEFIWWNNGLYYRNGDKNFYFGSPGFFHLAKGGSIRNAPDRHHFTRRMAKIFVNLPYDFDQTDKDMYIYCYGKALKAGNLLSDMLQQFVRHHADHNDLQEELEKWNPIIQKLADPEFEAFHPVQAVEFTGYIYHCLRDKPGFTVQRRSIATLLRDSIAYNTRIRERAERREAIRQAREQRAKAEKRKKLGSWKPHKTIQHYELYPYKIVELTNKQMLQNEGLVMNHCVGSYAQQCLNGHCTIWSLREKKQNNWFSLVTIELDRNKTVRQASARFNATPTKEHMDMVSDWAAANKVNLGQFRG